MPFFGRQMRVLQWHLFAPTDTNHQRLRRWTHLTSTPLDQAQERTRLRAHRINGQGTHQPGDELFAGILTAHRNRFGVISDALLLEQGPAVLQYYRYFVPLRYCYRPKRHKPNAQHGWRIQPIRQRVKRSGTSLRAQQQRLSASSTRCCWRNDGNSVEWLSKTLIADDGAQVALGAPGGGCDGVLFGGLCCGTFWSGR